MLLRLLVAILFATSAYAEEIAAPFGLKWGASVSEVEAALGVAPEDELLWGRVISFDSQRAPVTPPDTDFIFVAVDPDFGMGRINWVSTGIQNDAFGRDGKRKFDDLKALLTEKYGVPQMGMERVGLRLWKGGDEFYQCLDYEGCGLWYALWKVGDPAMEVVLELKGLRRGEGYLRMVYAGPNWLQIVAAVKAAQRKARQDAF